jgi:periplasmic copper chaperone A
VRPADNVPDLTGAILTDAHRGAARRRGLLVGTATAAVLLLAIVAGVGMLGNDEPPPLLASIDGVATTARAGTNGAVYLEFVNDGGSDRLTGAASSEAVRAELHLTESREGLTVMVHEDDRPIDGHSTTVFAPGGSHVMLSGLRGDLEPGDVVELTLQFEHSASRTVTVPVVGHADLPDQFWLAGT